MYPIIEKNKRFFNSVYQTSADWPLHILLIQTFLFTRTMLQYGPIASLLVIF